MNVIDNVTLIEFVRAFDSELNRDLHVSSTEPYIYSLTQIIPFKWTREHEKLFQNNKTGLVKKLFWLYQIQSTRSISTLILLALLPDLS